MNDTLLEQNIASLKSAIVSWAKQNNLWSNGCFQSWLERCDDEPQESPCVLVFCPGDGLLSDILHGSSHTTICDEFEEIVKNCGYYFELDGYGALFFYVDRNDELEEAYRNYFEWQWICSLVKPEFSDLYNEIYQRFYKQPDDLYHLEPRKFEILLDGIFRNNGYQTQLGPGWGDGGVDLRLYSNDVIGEVLTVVQAKRYAHSNPIKLEAVQALSGVVEDEKANQGLFITTSRYLPCAEKFAARQNKRLKLATSKDVSLWSYNAAEIILQNKSRLVKPEYVQSLLNTKGSSDSLEGKIFHANTGYTMTINSFVLVLRESKGAVLLIKLPVMKLSGDSQQGYEIPYTESVFVDYLEVDFIFRAKKKKQDNGNLYLWGNQNLYSLWDGQPKYYDYCD